MLCESAKSRKTRCFLLKWVWISTLAFCGSFSTHQRRQGLGHMGQRFKEVAVFGDDEGFHLVELNFTELFLGEAFEQLLAPFWLTPKGAGFVLVFEKLQQLAEEQFHV